LKGQRLTSLLLSFYSHTGKAVAFDCSMARNYFIIKFKAMSSYKVITNELLGEEKVTYVRRYNNKERAMQIAESLIEDGYTYVKIEDSKGEVYAEYEM